MYYGWMIVINYIHGFNGHPSNSKYLILLSQESLGNNRGNIKIIYFLLFFFELHESGGITVSTEGGSVNVFSEMGVEIPFCADTAALVLGGKIPFAFCKFMKNLVPPPKKNTKPPITTICPYHPNLLQVNKESRAESRMKGDAA